MAISSRLRQPTDPVIQHIICSSNLPCFLQIVDEDYSMCIPENTSYGLCFSGFGEFWESHDFRSQLLRFRTLWCTFIRFSRLFSPLTWLRSMVVDPCFILYHKSTQKLVRIAVKICQILLQSGHTNAFMVDCEQPRYPSCTELSHAQMCMQNINHTLIRKKIV